MENTQRFYWIKLKTDFFDLPTIDWLFEQEHGCEYIVLYQKLCLITANNGGELSRRIGEMIIPYDPKKIAEITHFNIDTVAVALELYKRLRMIYVQENGILSVADVSDMVGSESKWAEKKRLQRGQHKDNVPLIVPPQADNVQTPKADNVSDMSTNDEDIVRQEIEYRDRDRDKRESKSKRGSKPAPETAYGEFGNVKLTDGEHGKLLARYGQAKVSEYIESLSLYMGSSHKHYASHYATILKWLKRDGVPETGTKKTGRYAEW